MKQEYTIYYLSDPRTNVPRYVGITRLPVEKRLQQHWCQKDKHHCLAEWFVELRKARLKPIVTPLERVKHKPFIQEVKIIFACRQAGIPLLNKTEPQNPDVKDCFWTRWTKHPDFPHSASREDKLMFAIRKHCAQTKNGTFFLGVRDASLVTGGTYRTAANVLTRLTKKGLLTKLPPPTSFRHAQSYALPTPPPLPSPSPPIKTPQIQS